MLVDVDPLDEKALWESMKRVPRNTILALARADTFETEVSAGTDMLMDGPGRVDNQVDAPHRFIHERAAGQEAL